MLTTIGGRTTRAHISHTKEPARRVHEHAAIHPGEKALRLVASAQKMWPGVHASSKEKAQNFSVTKVVTEPYCQ